MISELGEQEARALLQANAIGRLACCELRGENSTPYVVPVNYVLLDDSIYVHALPGRKIRALRANPHACLQVDEIADPYHWRSVIAFGHYEEITDTDERDRVLAELFKHLPHLTPVESRMTEGVAQTIVFRLRITNINGVFEQW